MIRPATAEDVDVLLDLAEQMHAESQYSVLKFSRTKIRDLFMACITQDSLLLAVAEEHGEVFGGICAYAMPHYASDDLCAGDFGLFLRADKRGGITAGRLIRLYHGWAMSMGAKLIQLGTTTGINTEVVEEFYQRLGFSRIGALFSIRGD